MKHSVQVTILGQQYTVRSEASAEEVREVAAFVNDKISEVLTARKTADTLDAAVLALLNVAGAYLRLQNERPVCDEGTEERLRHLLGRLEQACPDPPTIQD